MTLLYHPGGLYTTRSKLDTKWQDHRRMTDYIFNFICLIIIAVNSVPMLFHPAVVDNVINVSEVHAVSIFDLGSSI
jgi:hypothetical protein